MINKLPHNIKTTVLGIATILTAVSTALVAILDGDAATTFDMGTTIAAITAGVGLIMAKDAAEKK